MQYAYSVHQVANLTEGGELIDVPGETWFANSALAIQSFQLSNSKRKDLDLSFEEINPDCWDVTALQKGKKFLLGRITGFRFPEPSEILHTATHL